MKVIWQGLAGFCIIGAALAAVGSIILAQLLMTAGIVFGLFAVVSVLEEVLKTLKVDK